jgi:hypothetical protein
MLTPVRAHAYTYVYTYILGLLCTVGQGWAMHQCYRNCLALWIALALRLLKNLRFSLVELNYCEICCD